MGKLIKNHWARLIILTASAYQFTAGLCGFFWPKIFFDFLTTNLDHIVRPYPILQAMNLVLGLIGLAWEWPLPIFTTAAKKCSAEARARNKAPNLTGAGRPTPSKAATITTTTVNTTASIYSTGRNSPPACSPIHHAPSDPPARFHYVLASLHRSIEARLIVYPLSTLCALLLYQGTNAGLYYMLGMCVYFWGYSEGEVIMGVPWSLPKRMSTLRSAASHV